MIQKKPGNWNGSAQYDYREAQSIYDDTIDSLKTFDESQLKAVHSVIVELTVAQEKWHSRLGIKTEDDLMREYAQ